MKKALKTAGLTTVGVLSAAVATASDSILPIADINPGDAENDLPTVIQQGFSVLMGLMGIVAVSIVLYGGWKLLISGGEESEVADAKKLMIYGVVGILVIAAAWILASFALTAIGEIVGSEDIIQSGQL